MIRDAAAYAFRSATPADLPLLRRWLSTPEVVRWWGDPTEQAALLEQDLNEPLMVMRIVSFEGRPFAYAQDYAVHVWPQPHFSHLPPGSRAIDAFIGEPDMLGQGHGTVLLRLLAERLRAEGAPLVAIDPDVDNLRARRAYRNAGFKGDTVVESGEGPAVLMIFAASPGSPMVLPPRGPARTRQREELDDPPQHGAADATQGVARQRAEGVRHGATLGR